MIAEVLCTVVNMWDLLWSSITSEVSTWQMGPFPWK